MVAKTEKKLTKAERRVRVAKDVIKQLKFNQRFSTYGWASIPITIDLNDSAQKHIKMLQRECEACALGKCFLSFIKLENKVKMKEIARKSFYDDDINAVRITRGTVIQKLGKLFSEDQLDLIEACFEQTTVFARSVIPSKALDFTKDLTKEERLKAIMLNVIENKGVFKP